MRILNQIRSLSAMKIVDGTASRSMRQRGFMLIELMISMVILTVGLGGLLVLLITAMNTDKNSSGDTSSTMVAEHVLEQITAQGVGANSPPNPPLTVTDCAGTVWNINTARAALNAGSGANGGNGANLTAGGIIDWTQAYAGVPAGYAMLYVGCGAGSQQTIYDVRWNVIQMSANSRLTVISARPGGQRQIGGLKFVVPVNLRTID
jgi:type II secretory pathway pseudopilin PulG